MPGEPSTTTVSRARPTGTRSARRRHRVAVLAAVGAGGALGSMARYALAEVWSVEPGRFPWTTFVINVLGSLLLGVVLTVVVEHWPPSRYLRPFLATGICGGFTTWSTFMTETTLLVRDGHPLLASTYVVVAVAGGLAATAAGVWLGGRRRSALA
jgi:fluoride exporter